MPEACQPRGSRIRGHGETENNAPPAIHGAEKHDCRQQFTHSPTEEEDEDIILTRGVNNVYTQERETSRAPIQEG